MPDEETVYLYQSVDGGFGSVIGGFTGWGVGIGLGSGRSGMGLGLGSFGNWGDGGLTGSMGDFDIDSKS